MVSNTSKKCLLALVLFSSLAPISLHCADGSKSTPFWKSPTFTSGASFIVCAGAGVYVGTKFNEYRRAATMTSDGELQEAVKKTQKREVGQADQK